MKMHQVGFVLALAALLVSWLRRQNASRALSETQRRRHHASLAAEKSIGMLYAALLAAALVGAYALTPGNAPWTLAARGLLMIGVAAVALRLFTTKIRSLELPRQYERISLQSEVLVTVGIIFAMMTLK